MANFQTHVTVAATASTGAAIAAVNAHLTASTNMPWLILLGLIGGLLPDIDADNSRPVRLLFDLLGLVAALSILQAVKKLVASEQALLLAGAGFLVIRFGLFALFNQLTDHRGVFHSLLAACFFALLTTYVCHHFWRCEVLFSWLSGVFVGIGYIVHLLLDECFSVNLTNARMKKSFGTAMKLGNRKNPSATALMLIPTIALGWLSPSPSEMVVLIRAVLE